MIFGYADPPYLGNASLYAKHHADASVWDTPDEHERLIERLCEECPDGWAMSASSPSLRTILPLCPDDVRVGAWVKPFAIFKPNVGVAYAWEPVIFRGGRRVTREQPTRRDWLAENITLQKGLTGAKPQRFCRWVFSILNAEVGDVMLDLFPGTGIVGDTWQTWDGVRDTEIGGSAVQAKAT